MVFFILTMLSAAPYKNGYHHGGAIKFLKYCQEFRMNLILTQFIKNY